MIKNYFLVTESFKANIDKDIGLDVLKSVGFKCNYIFWKMAKKNSTIK